MVCFTLHKYKRLPSVVGGFLEQENVAHVYFNTVTAIKRSLPVE